MLSQQMFLAEAMPCARLGFKEIRSILYPAPPQGVSEYQAGKILRLLGLMLGGLSFPEEEIFQVFEPLLIFLARDMRRHARSYRKFNVGCALLARTPEFLAIFTGANFKPVKDVPTECAEKNALELAKIMEARTVLGMVVSGESQFDEASGLHSRVLHPCGKCREMFREQISKTGLMRKDTRLILITPDGVCCEETTPEKLYGLHNGGNGKGMKK